MAQKQFEQQDFKFIVLKEPAKVFSIVEGVITHAKELGKGKVVTGRFVEKGIIDEDKKRKGKPKIIQKKFIEIENGGYLYPTDVSIYLPDFFSSFEGGAAPKKSNWLWWLFPVAGAAAGIYLAHRAGGETINYVAYSAGLAVIGLLPVMFIK